MKNFYKSDDGSEVSRLINRRRDFAFAPRSENHYYINGRVERY